MADFTDPNDAPNIDDDNAPVTPSDDARHDDALPKVSDSDNVSKDDYEKLQKKFLELSAENKKYRLKASDASKKAIDSEKKANDALEKTSKLHTSYEQKLIRAELKAAAVNAGLIDIDAFKMVDLSHVKLSDEGDVVGVEKIISDLKASKAYLFKSNSSSPAHDVPDPSAQTEDVSELSDEEYIKKYPRKWRR